MCLTLATTPEMTTVGFGGLQEGEREREKKKKKKQRGIPLIHDVWTYIRAMCSSSTVTELV